MQVMETRDEIIARRVRELREEEALTQQELADIAEVHQVTISHLETGGKRPRPSTVRKIARVFGLTPKQLVRGQESLDGDS